MSGEDVRKSNRQTDRSVAADARSELSTALNDTVVVVSTEVGHARVCVGFEDGRDRS